MPSTLFSTTGIVLSRQDYKEADRVYSFLSADRGKLDLVARGGSRPKAKVAPHMESLSLVKALLVEGKGHRLTVAGADIVESYHELLSRPDQAHLALAGLHLIDLGLRTDHEEPNVFDEALEWLHFLSEMPELSSGRSGILLGALVLKLSRHFGYEPELESCLHCRNKIESDAFEWSSTRGGVVCPNCLSAHAEQWLRTHKLYDHTLKLLRLALSHPYETLLQTHIEGPILLEFNGVIDSLILAHFPVIPTSSIAEMCRVD